MKPVLELVPLLELIRPQMEQVESILHQVAASADEPLRSRLRASFDGGKRLRPALVVLAGQVFVPSSPRFHKLAAAVETLHTATLVHDDLVDGSHLRRGRSTLHTVWPAGAAVLAGDYLLASAAGLIGELEEPTLLRVLTDALRAMCAGEIQQMFAQPGRHRTRGEYYRAIDAKTASLCAAATEMAARLAAAGEAQAAALHCFGRELGLAFQIADDVLDFVGDETALGKPAGSDLRQGIVTLPVLWYLERCDGDSPVQAVLAGERDARQVQAAIEAVRESGAIEAALAEARTHAQLGQDALAGLPDNDARQMLHTLATLVVVRNR